MHLLVELLLLGDLAAQPAPSAISKETDQILSTIPGHETCANPNENDARPYTLCLSETWFEQAEAELESQFKVTLAHVEATRRPSAARHLADRQLKWTKRRDRECEKLMADSPVTQVGRNNLNCQTNWTERRTAELNALAKR